jgi:hypothetical protein
LQRGLFLDDDAGVLISACLCSPTARARRFCRIEPPPKNKRCVEWKFTDSRLVTAERDTLRFSHKNGMLRNILLPQSPASRRQNCREIIFRFARRRENQTRTNHRLDFAHRRARRDFVACAKNFN